MSAKRVRGGGQYPSPLINYKFFFNVPIFIPKGVKNPSENYENYEL